MLVSESGDRELVPAAARTLSLRLVRMWLFASAQYTKHLPNRVIGARSLTTDPEGSAANLIIPLDERGRAGHSRGDERFVILGTG